jgi:hypothetical protein
VTGSPLCSLSVYSRPFIHLSGARRPDGKMSQ